MEHRLREYGIQAGIALDQEDYGIFRLANKEMLEETWGITDPTERARLRLSFHQARIGVLE